jgi:hypothetical protein
MQEWTADGADFADYSEIEGLNARIQIKGQKWRG